MNSYQIKPDTVVATNQCASCPFRESGGLELGLHKSTIESYLIEGTNHFCHSDDSHKTICRGGRDYQLMLWHRLGIISEPTDDALREAMISMGMDPGAHI